MKKVTHIFLLVMGSLSVVQAQNAFEQFGYKDRVLTMTNGRFNETHDADSIVQIGSVLFDVNKKKIVGNAEEDTITYMPNPTIISRWWSIDPLAEKYYGLSPYNFVANNPVLYTDPDGREIRVHFENAEAKKIYLQIVNGALGGQFNVTLNAVKGKDGYFSVGLVKTKDGGDMSKLGKGAQSFYEKMNTMIKSSDIINLNIVHNDDEVHIGQFGSKEQKIDMADVAQFPKFDPTKDEQDGPTQAGKIIHESEEQFSRFSGLKIAHDRAMGHESTVNGNTRLIDVKAPGYNQGVIESFRLKNGSVVSFQVLGGQYSDKRGTIILVPVTKK
jgi:hypothetical protein